MAVNISVMFQGKCAKTPRQTSGLCKEEHSCTHLRGASQPGGRSIIKFQVECMLLKEEIV